MKTKINSILSVLLIATTAFTACKKEDSAGTPSTTAAVSGTIAVVSSSSVATADTVYIVNSCNRNEKTDFIAQSELPAAISDYLSANYAGYSFFKAFSVVNSSSAVTGYVVIIYYNDKPVGLKFDSSGNFIRVLEQRQGSDLEGPGWHAGGHFEHRNGDQKDTIAPASLPPAVLSYMNTQYSADTLIKAYKTRDSGYLVLSRNNGLFATVFDASGNFVKRTQLPSGAGNCQSIGQAALPPTSLAYLSATYPNYIFEKAFSISAGGAIQGYVVLIDANNTKYAVSFDASGNFIQAKTVF
jgi:hypothetical protein